jgi:hypothetical protein
MAFVAAEPALLAGAAIADVLFDAGAVAAVEAGEASIANIVGEESASAVSFFYNLAQRAGILGVAEEAAAVPLEEAGILAAAEEGAEASVAVAESGSATVFAQLASRISAEVLPMIGEGQNPVTILMALVGIILKTVAPEKALYILGWLWFMFEAYSWSTTFEALPKDIIRLKNHISEKLEGHVFSSAQPAPSQDKPWPSIEEYLHESTQPEGELEAVENGIPNPIPIKDQIKQFEMARKQQKKIALGVVPKPFKAQRPHRTHKSHFIVPPTLPAATHAQMKQNALLPLKPSYNAAALRRKQLLREDL